MVPTAYKRAPYTFGDPFTFGLGKGKAFPFGLGKRRPYRFVLGKRDPYAFGLGKRSSMLLAPDGEECSSQYLTKQEWFRCIYETFL